MSASAGDYVREGEALLQEKSYSQALIAFSRALNLDPRLASAHYKIGAIILTDDHPAESIPPLMTAVALGPNNSEFVLAFSQALLRVGQRARAASLLAQTSNANPTDSALRDAAAQLPLNDDAGAEMINFMHQPMLADVDNKISNAAMALQNGQFATAYKLASALIWLAPQSADVWKIMSRSAFKCAPGALAELSARRAIAINPSDAQSWLTLGGIIRAAQRPHEAEEALRHGLKFCWPDPDLAAALCEVLFASNQRQTGLDLLGKVETALEKPSVRLMALRANAHAQANEIDEARKTFTAGLALEPTNMGLVGAAVSFYEKQTDPKPMLDILKKAKEFGAAISEGEILDAQARIFLRGNKLDEAHASITQALRSQSGREQSTSRHYLLAQIEDKRGNFHNAFEAALTANRMMEDIWEVSGPCDHTMATRRLSSLHRRLEAETQSGQKAAQEDNTGPQNIAFLVGFPRSGTTLLDTILRSHSKVVVVEEEKVLINTLRDGASGITGDETNFTEEWLEHLHECDPGLLRKKYLSQMTGFAGEDLADDKIYIDKLPLNMNWAPMIHRIFPRAVFILALRHPLDIAISNLFQDFKPNNAMMNMTSLARVNNLYHASFSLWNDFETWRRPNVERVSYEEIVGNLENTVSRVMTRLDLSWEEAQSRYFETAIKRGGMKTPSYTQVTQKLYSTSKERWRNYAFAFQGDDTRDLRSWAVDLGYSLDKELK